MFYLWWDKGTKVQINDKRHRSRLSPTIYSWYILVPIYRLQFIWLCNSAILSQMALLVTRPGTNQLCLIVIDKTLPVELASKFSASTHLLLVTHLDFCSANSQACSQRLTKIVVVWTPMWMWNAPVAQHGCCESSHEVIVACWASTVGG
jgi:hypothetical protein